jgi:hypothetical protein
VVPVTVGLAKLEQPLRGRWTFRGFPPAVSLLGRPFTRAKWQAPRAGVVAQYREDVDRYSLHLYVLEDGTWIIDHSDDANPDRGLVLEHTFRDVIHTPVGALALVAVVVLASAGLSYALTR